MFCSKCGSEIPNGARFCLTCGTPATASAAPAPAGPVPTAGVPVTPTSAPATAAPTPGAPTPGAPMPGAPTPGTPTPGAPTPATPYQGGTQNYGMPPYGGGQVPPYGGNQMPPYGGNQMPPYGYAAPAPKEPSLSIVVLKRAIGVIAKKPFLLWGLSLLSGLLSLIAYILGGPVLAIGVAVSWVLTLGMEWVYLAGLKGEEISAKQLFAGFKDFWRSFAGMAWRDLWLILWAMIPFAGTVFAVIKTYSYQLTPFLLRENPDENVCDVLKDSMAKTNGYKGKMFLTDLIIVGCVLGVDLVLGLFSMIPYVGVLFSILLMIFSIAVSIFAPLFCGLVRAAWYEEITKA